MKEEPHITNLEKMAQLWRDQQSKPLSGKSFMDPGALSNAMHTEKHREAEAEEQRKEAREPSQYIYGTEVRKLFHLGAATTAITTLFGAALLWYAYSSNPQNPTPAPKQTTSQPTIPPTISPDEPLVVERMELTSPPDIPEQGETDQLYTDGENLYFQHHLKPELLYKLEPRPTIQNQGLIAMLKMYLPNYSEATEPGLGQAIQDLHSPTVRKDRSALTAVARKPINALEVILNEFPTYQGAADSWIASHSTAQR
tara:strand:- start:429 stop:1193 length:765 start_codon:yes stop_codon:yes gene_type:complete